MELFICYGDIFDVIQIAYLTKRKKKLVYFVGKERPGSHKTRVYDDGQFVDAGYDSISTNNSSLPTYNNNSNGSNKSEAK